MEESTKKKLLDLNTEKHKLLDAGNVKEAKKVIREMEQILMERAIITEINKKFKQP